MVIPNPLQTQPIAVLKPISSLLDCRLLETDRQRRLSGSGRRARQDVASRINHTRLGAVTSEWRCQRDHTLATDQVIDSRFFQPTRSLTGFEFETSDGLDRITWTRDFKAVRWEFVNAIFSSRERAVTLGVETRTDCFDRIREWRVAGGVGIENRQTRLECGELGEHGTNQ